MKQQGKFLHKLLALPGVCKLCLHCPGDAVMVKFTAQSLPCAQRLLEDSEHGLIWMPQQTQIVTLQSPLQSMFLALCTSVLPSAPLPLHRNSQPGMISVHQYLNCRLCIMACFVWCLALLLTVISVFVNRSFLLPYRIQKRSRKSCCYLNWELAKMQVDVNWSVLPIFSG